LLAPNYNIGKGFRYRIVKLALLPNNKKGTLLVHAFLGNIRVAVAIREPSLPGFMAIHPYSVVIAPARP
jgi:hypothetical protein